MMDDYTKKLILDSEVDTIYRDVIIYRLNKKKAKKHGYDDDNLDIIFYLNKKKDTTSAYKYSELFDMIDHDKSKRWL